MSEPRAIGKTKTQISNQIGRIADAINARMRTATSENERRVLRNRYNTMADAYNNYIDRMNSSSAMTRAINRYLLENGSFAGIADTLDNVRVPRSQYVRNNRR